MKILHVLDERWDSAVTEYGLLAAAALKRRGHAVWIAAWPGLHAEREARRRGIETAPLSGPLRLRRLVAARGIDLVNAHTGRGQAWGLAAALGRRVALVRTRGEARDLRRSLSRAWLYRRTAAVICPSVALTQRHRALYPESAPRLHTVYPGLPEASYVDESAGPVRFALVGRLDPIKGQLYFLEAVDQIKAELSDQEFIVCGEEKNTRLSGLKAYAEKHGLTRWVRFLGRQQDVLAFMRSCHVGVICSIGSEALSRVCLEWMAAGRPVVAAAVGCLPELVATGENGFLVPSHAPQALAKCFLGMIKNPTFRRALGRAAHETAVTRFGAERFALETEKAYLEALRPRP